MPVLKNKTQGRYVNMNRSALENRALGLKERGLLVTLLSLPDTWDFTISGIASILPDGRHAITTSLKNLMDAGYVTKMQERDKNGKFGEIIIEVHETPIRPMSEKPISEKRTTGKPVPENHAELNNNRLSNNKLNTNKYSRSNSNNKFVNFKQRDYQHFENLERALIEM